MDDEHTIRVHWNTDKRTLFFYQNYLERKLLLPNLSHFCHFDTQTDQNLQRVCVCVQFKTTALTCGRKRNLKKTKPDGRIRLLLHWWVSIFLFLQSKQMQMLVEIEIRWGGGRRDEWLAPATISFWGCLQITSRDLKLTSLWLLSRVVNWFLWFCFIYIRMIWFQSPISKPVIIPTFQASPRRSLVFQEFHQSGRNK